MGIPGSAACSYLFHLLSCPHERNICFRAKGVSELNITKSNIGFVISPSLSWSMTFLNSFSPPVLLRRGRERLCRCLVAGHGQPTTGFKNFNIVMDQHKIKKALFNTEQSCVPLKRRRCLLLSAQVWHRTPPEDIQEKRGSNISSVPL